jgi:hypothetical protein
MIKMVVMIFLRKCRWCISFQMWVPSYSTTSLGMYLHEEIRAVVMVCLESPAAALATTTLVVPTTGRPNGDSNEFQSRCSNGHHLGRA